MYSADISIHCWIKCKLILFKKYAGCHGWLNILKLKYSMNVPYTLTISAMIVAVDIIKFHFNHQPVNKVNKAGENTYTEHVLMNALW